MESQRILFFKSVISQMRSGTAKVLWSLWQYFTKMWLNITKQEISSFLDF